MRTTTIFRILGAVCVFVLAFASTACEKNTSVTGVELNESTATLVVGETLTLVATVLPQNATNQKVTWASSDKSIAAVVDGLVTALNTGSVTITVTTEDGKKTENCVLSITENCDEIIITGDWITSPKWMADIIDSIINVIINVARPGIFCWTSVYSVEFEEQTYFHVRNLTHSSNIHDLFLFFTCKGERIRPGLSDYSSPPYDDLWYNLLNFPNIIDNRVWQSKNFCD